METAINLEIITEMADELGEAMETTKEFIDYQSVKEQYDSDETLQKLIGEFNLKKMSVMSEMQKEDAKDETKLAEYQQQMRDAYAEILKNEVYTDYNEKKTALENMVNRVYTIINAHITGDEGGCSGSCSTCGGCH